MNSLNETLDEVINFGAADTSPEAPEEKAAKRTPPPMYAVLRSNQGLPEPLRADSDEQARGILQRQVRVGKVNVMYLYKLISAEVYEPSSRTASIEEILEGKHLSNVVATGVKE